MINHSFNDYYESRKDFNYYKKIINILNDLNFLSILDVGGRRSPILESLTNPLIDKALLDTENGVLIPGIRNITANFYTWTPDKKYDIVGCFQVLEHLDNPKHFSEKLFEIAKYKVLISVPYKWKKGQCKYHVQDPVDESKLQSWTNRIPDESYIINDGVDRLICVYNIKQL